MVKPAAKFWQRRIPPSPTHTLPGDKRGDYPERSAQEALGYNSKAVHRAYAKRALMKIPFLEDYEQQAVPKIESTA
jgi:hypothetical protein